MADKIGIALIGAGRTGTPMLKELLKYPYITIVGVADLNPTAEGIKIAAEQGIYTTSNPMALVSKGDAMDILIELSGDASLKKAVKAAFAKNGNKKTIIMHELVARLFISVCTQQTELIPTVHPEDIGIGN